jgi:pimeloyl-ACP methyl ester carboxylesterase
MIPGKKVEKGPDTIRNYFLRFLQRSSLMNSRFIHSFLFLSLSGLLLTGISSCEKDNDALFDPVSQDIVNVDKDHPPSFHELFIPSHGVSLSGFLLGANGPGPHPTVVLLHGFPGNEKNLDLAQSMRRAGFNVLFFHYRGAWGSEGDYALIHLAEDAASALQFLRQSAETLRVDVHKISVVGHSMGGFTALRTAARDEGVICVVGIAAANLGEYAEREESAAKGFKVYADGLFMLRNFGGDKALAEIDTYAEEFDVRNDGPALAGKSVLLVAGSRDTTVPPDVQERIALAYGDVAGLKLRAEVIPGDHSFSTSRIQLQHLVIDWLDSDCR